MPSNPFNPDHAASPGQVLEMHLESCELSVDEFAKRCDLPAEFVQEIISGEAPLDRETALLFEREFGSKAYIWLGIEVECRQKLARDGNCSGHSVPIFQAIRRCSQLLRPKRVSKFQGPDRNRPHWLFCSF